MTQRFTPVIRASSERAVCLRDEEDYSSGLGSDWEEEEDGGSWEVAFRDLDKELPDATHETNGM